MKKQVVSLKDQPQEDSSAPLFNTKQAMEALRSSGHSMLSALGEVIDNAQEAGAREIRIFLEGGNGKNATQLDRVVIVDDGEGMTRNILPMAIGLGSSTRFNSRKGIGRFGVGATLGGISQARRIDYYSKCKNGEVNHTYLDLDSLSLDQRNVIPAVPANFPAELDLDHLKHGTVIIWDKLDLNESGRTQKTVKIETLQNEILFYAARTYRKFLEAGLKIEVNGIDVIPWDPLFVIPSERFPNDKPATIILDESFIFETDAGLKSPIEVRITLLDEKFRKNRGDGNATRNPEVKKRKIHLNEGVSIVRNGREIFFDKLGGLGGQDIDRYIGMEISFNAELDEYFAVKHVKKGAEPIQSLRDSINQAMGKAVAYARKEIRKTHKQSEVEKCAEGNVHEDAENAAEEYEKKAPKGEVGSGKSPAEIETLIDAVAQKVVETGNEGRKTKEEVKQRIKQKPFSILGDAWSGREFVAIDHISRSNAAIRLNHSHVFFTHVYQPLLRAAGYLEQEHGQEPEQLSQEELVVIKNALDLLIVAYAKAEGWNETCLPCHEELRLNWGNFLHCMITELDKK